MKICITRPPERWWPEGLPRYENNRAMEFAAEHGIVPCSSAVAHEFERLEETLSALADVHVFEFPDALNQADPPRHDFVFCRDSFVAGRDRTVVLARFREARRNREAEHYRSALADLGYELVEAPEDAHVEGGEVFYLREENILISGLNRANEAGVRFLADRFGGPRTYAFPTLAFHLDTSFTPVLDADGHLVAALAYLEFFTSSGRRELERFARETGVPILSVHAEDSVGPVVGRREEQEDEVWLPPASLETPGERAEFEAEARRARSLGQYCINCLALPGVLVGSAPFVTPGLEEELARLGIRHVTTPLTQYRYSAGGVHCATNELPG